jgi:hypothetical protein
MELTDSGLVYRTPAGESVRRLEALGRVAVTANYAFIYVSALSAIVVPRDAVTAGDFDQFIAAVAERVAAAKKGPGP